MVTAGSNVLSAGVNATELARLTASGEAVRGGPRCARQRSEGDAAGASPHLYVEVRRAWAVDMSALDDAQALKNAGLGARIEREQLQVAPDCADDPVAAREVADTTLSLTAIRQAVSGYAVAAAGGCEYRGRFRRRSCGC